MPRWVAASDTSCREIVVSEPVYNGGARHDNFSSLYSSETGQNIGFLSLLGLLGCRTSAEATSASKTTSSPDALFQLVDDHYVGHDNLLNNELSNAVADFNREVRVGQVCENDAYGTAVIGVNDARKSINAVFVRKARAGGYSAICILL